MKTKLYALGVLCTIGLAMTAGDAAAFSLLPRCCKDEKEVCRPYNAFSPVCYTKHHGHHRPAGCCPYCCGISCPPPICGSLYPMCGDMCCPPYAGAPTGVLPDSSTMVPEGSNPNFVPPPPTPTPTLNQTSMPWGPQSPYGLQPAAYQQGQYPSYPTNYYPANSYPTAVPMSVPYYWYNNR